MYNFCLNDKSSSHAMSDQVGSIILSLIFHTIVLFCFCGVFCSSVPWYKFVTLLWNLMWNQLWFDTVELQIFKNFLVWERLSRTVFTAYYKLLQKDHKFHIINEKYTCLSLLWFPLQKLKHYLHSSTQL